MNVAAKFSACTRTIASGSTGACFANQSFNPAAAISLGPDFCHGLIGGETTSLHVLGITGQAGSAVARTLLRSGEPVRTVLRG
ncbi:UNVERIFIED_ORG: hypothetical protein J2Y81_007909 [Paraburkholderia sediminicola]|nr:hypothetical protein [Paraburkholderia sediminicola]